MEHTPEMGESALKQMRKKQLLLSLILNFIAIAAGYYLFIESGILLSRLFFMTSLLLLLFSIYKFTTARSAKRILPFYQKIAAHEKSKLGAEWEKQNNTKGASLLLLAMISFGIALVAEGSTLPLSLPPFYYLMIFLVACIADVPQKKRYFRKIDQASGPEEMEGDTERRNIKIVKLTSIALVIWLVVIIILFQVY